MSGKIKKKIKFGVVPTARAQCIFLFFLTVVWDSNSGLDTVSKHSAVELHSQFLLFTLSP